MHFLRKILRTIGMGIASIVSLAMTAGILAVIAFGMVIFYYNEDLPSTQKLTKYEPPIVTRLYAADGKLLAEYATERRVYVPLNAIPKRVRNAFLSAEDQNFYKHQGIDPQGILRALRDNLANRGTGSRLAGGSTITQQVVKNFLLSNEQSLERKIKEAILAFRISSLYSKDRILELYLNEIYLGQGSYGVAAAALNYFNKPLDELTVEEVAFLAAMPKAPANYDPNRHYDRAKNRRDWVINRMLEDEYITPEEAELAQNSAIVLRKRDAEDIARADFFAEEVRRSLAAMYGSNILYEGGLWVKTTLEPELQAFADKALRNGLIQYDRRHGWRGPVKTLNIHGDWQRALAAINPADVPLIEGQALAVVMKFDGSLTRISFADGSTGTIPFSEMVWARKALAEGELGPTPKKPEEVVNIGDVIITRPLQADKNTKAEKAEKAAKNDTKNDAKTDANSDTTNADAALKPKEYTLLQVPKVNGGMVVLDPHTGKVLAMSGGYAYGRTEFNRATQARRQPGSAFKPFVYLAALEFGYTPASIILDGPISLSQGAGMPAWSPQNYSGDYLGPTPLRVGVEKSRNAMTVRLAAALGIDRVIAIGRRFGIYDTLPRNFSIVLGAAETTLLRLTNAYAMLVNGGYRITPALIERIDDRNGRTLFRRDTRECPQCQLDPNDTIAIDAPPPILDTRERVLDERVAYQMVSILEGVVERGTATRAKSIGKPLGGKTGTTNDSRDVWFIGFSPDLVAGIYIGYDAPKSLGPKETGGSVAVPAFTEFMQAALSNVPAKPFRIPAGIQLVKLDPANGQPANPADPSIKPKVETMITGGPIYLPPGAYGDLPTPGTTNDPEAAMAGITPPSDLATAPDEEGMHTTNSAPVVPGVPETEAPLQAPANAPERRGNKAEDKTTDSSATSGKPGPAKPSLSGTGGLY